MRDPGQDRRRGRPVRRDLRDLFRPGDLPARTAAARRQGRRAGGHAAGGRQLRTGPDAAERRRLGPGPGDGGRRRAGAGLVHPAVHPAQPPGPADAGGDGAVADRADHRRGQEAGGRPQPGPGGATGVRQEGADRGGPALRRAPARALRLGERQEPQGRAPGPQGAQRRGRHRSRRPGDDAGPGEEDGQAAGRPLLAPPQQGPARPPGRPPHPAQVHGLWRHALRDHLEDQEGREAEHRGDLRRLQVRRRRSPVPADLPL